MVQSQEAHSLTIGRLAQAGEMGVETVRFYQRKGLLSTPDKGGGVRRYGAEDIRRLRFIKQAQTAGFTLAEIHELLDLDATQERARARDLARARIASLNAKIAELEAARDALKRLAKDCAEGGVGPCPILTSFEA